MVAVGRNLEILGLTLFLFLGALTCADPVRVPSPPICPLSSLKDFIFVSNSDVCHISRDRFSHGVGVIEIYAWIGCNSAKFGNLYAAAPTRPSNTVGDTSLIGGASNNTGSGIARRLGGPSVGDIRSRCLRLSDTSTSEALTVRTLLGLKEIAPYHLLCAIILFIVIHLFINFVG